MQNSAALAYQQVGRQTVNPRLLEANLLSRAAGQLQRVRDDWENERHELTAALMFNRKLWTVFLGSVTGEESQLPKALRENIANLGLFVMKQTMTIQAEPSANKLTVLININREIAAGLRAGHALDRAPALMPHIHPDYYAGFFRDPDGRLIEFVCHDGVAAMAA